MNDIIHFTNFSLDFPQIKTDSDLKKAGTFMKDLSKAFTIGAYKIGGYLCEKEEELSKKSNEELGALFGLTSEDVAQSIEFATLGRALNLSVSQIEKLSKEVTKDLPDLEDHVPAMIEHLKGMKSALNA